MWHILCTSAARVGQLTDNALFLEPPLPVACGSLSACHGERGFGGERAASLEYIGGGEAAVEKGQRCARIGNGEREWGNGEREVDSPLAALPTAPSILFRCIAYGLRSLTDTISISRVCRRRQKERHLWSGRPRGAPRFLIYALTRQLS